MSATPRLAARRALERAIDRLGALHIDEMLSLTARIARGETGDFDAGMNRAGLVRAVQSNLEAALYVTEPDWRYVRAIHRIWVAGNAWVEAWKQG